jgi:Uncharacterised protein family (UPF0259)
VTQPRAGGAAENRRPRREQLRPGAIIAAAGRAGRRYWQPILAVAIPISLVGSGLEILIDHYVDPSDALLSASASLVSTAVSMLGTVLLSGIACRLVSAAEHGGERQPLLQAVRSLPWPRLIAADALVTVLVVVGFALFFLPGVAALTLLAVVGPVIEIEHPQVLAALRRSVRLTRHHVPSVVLLATLPLVVVAELEAIAPDPGRAGEIAEFLIIRGLAEGIVEAAIAVVLSELCFQLIDAEGVSRRPASGRAGPRLPGVSRQSARCR